MSCIGLYVNVETKTAGLPDVMVTVKEENSVLCAEPFITVNHETDHLYGQIEYEEMDFDRIKREIKLEETPNLKNQVMITYSGITARSNIEFSGCIKYVEQMEKLFHDYSNMSIKCKGFGPIRLVECPACTVQYKNSPDRLIRLFNHVNKCHRKKRMKFLQEILDSYYPLIRFMEKVLRIPAIQGPSYKN